MKDSESTNWKVIYVSSRSEKKVAERLAKAGVEYYLPLLRQMREWSDRRKWVEVPLFTGYLFIRPEPKRRDSVLLIPGVVKYLRYNGKDAYVTQQKLDTIRHLIERNYDIEDYNGGEQFELGDKVKIIAGPMKDFQGEILSRSGEKYAFLQLDNFGHIVKVKLPRQVLKKITEP